MKELIRATRRYEESVKTARYQLVQYEARIYDTLVGQVARSEFTRSVRNTVAATETGALCLSLTRSPNLNAFLVSRKNSI
jgi:hypothetical protein